MSSCPQCGAAMDTEEKACGQCGHRLEGGMPSAYRSSYTRSDLLAAGLSQAFVDFVVTNPKPKPFASVCEPKDLGWPAVVPAWADAAYPLWTSNANVTALIVRGGRREFYLLGHDDPKPVLLAATEQGLLARLFIQMVESPRATLPSLKSAAAHAGFEHFDLLWNLYEEYSDAADFGERLAALLSQVDGKPDAGRGR